METKDKELLLKDLCARLPYEVKVYLNTDMYPNWTGNYILTAIKSQYYLVQCSVKHFSCWCNLECVKPYLFPMSSMTEEQRKEMSLFDPFKTDKVKTLGEWAVCLVNFYNKYHLDYNGLIPKGLALDATGLNIY